MPGLIVDKVGGGGKAGEFDQDNKNTFIDLPEEAFINVNEESIRAYINSLYPGIEIGEKEIPHFRLKRGISRPLITEWELTDPASLAITLPVKDGAHKFFVNWGDGSPEELIENFTENIQHVYPALGTYQVKMWGVCEAFTFSNITNGPDGYVYPPDNFKLKAVISWGDLLFKKLDFHWCSNLVDLPLNEVPNLFYATSVNSLFYWCYKLTKVPECIFWNTPNTTDFSYLFVDTQLAEIPKLLFSRSISAKDFIGTFNGVDNFTEIPNQLFHSNPEARNFNDTFSNNGEFLKTIPFDLFYKNPKAETFARVFDGNDIQAIPSSLFANNPLATNFERAFYLNKNLTGPVPELWKREGSNGEECFYQCTKVSNYAQIPDNWKNSAL
ncbi:MAG: hypothetical protein WBL21_00045 [Salinimicrobium sp.]